jgi:hypothetical protein
MSDDAPPVLRIVRGTPDDAEIAALTAALVTVSVPGAAEPQPEPMSVWADRCAALRHPAGRRPLRPGRHAWRASALPG